jgi:hypothetical protein
MGYSASKLMGQIHKILAETASGTCATVFSGGSREADFDSFAEPEYYEF